MLQASLDSILHWRVGLKYGSYFLKLILLTNYFKPMHICIRRHIGKKVSRNINPTKYVVDLEGLASPAPLDASVMFRLRYPFNDDHELLAIVQHHTIFSACFIVYSTPLAVYNRKNKPMHNLLRTYICNIYNVLRLFSSRYLHAISS